MILITNRVLYENKNGLDMFGKEPNPAGPNEIRLVEVNEDASHVQPLTERLSDAELTTLEDKHQFRIDHQKDWYVSLRVACDLFERARTEQKATLLYVHGYNNDMDDVIGSAYELQRLYDIIVIPFSWPANGGGKLSGTAAYLDDKDDARASATALQRAVDRIRLYHELLTEGMRTRLMRHAKHAHPDDHERAYALYGRHLNVECRASINMMCHSMGNYVLKYATLPSNSSLRRLVFDNVSLVAADVNNLGHEDWVDLIPVRNRMYVVLNELDYALKWSRIKPGSEQLERLGHHLGNLASRKARYVDVTGAKRVGDSHRYFVGQPARNQRLQKMFRLMFSGGVPESTMSFHPEVNVYRPG